jgi:hypothetical protein
MSRTTPTDLDARIKELIRFKAKRLAGSPGFLRREEEGLRQELSLHVLDRMRRHDPARATRATYADRVLTSKVRDLVRRARAQRRDQRRVQSLEALPLRTVEELLARTLEAEHHADLRHDVPVVLAKLSDADRAVAVSLADHCVAEVTRRTGLSRQRVRSARLRARRQFENCEVAA